MYWPVVPFGFNPPDNRYFFLHSLTCPACILLLTPQLPEEEDDQTAAEGGEATNTGDTECYLRDTQTLLTSLQARVTDNTPITSSGGYRITPFESNDSGGDSDIDTSTSYVRQEPTRQPSSLRSKLKLSGLEGGSSKVAMSNGVGAPSSALSPRGGSGSNLKQRVGASDGGYEKYEGDDLSEQNSDSSSETSELLKETLLPKQNLNNPPLKYNRAFR